MEVRDYEELKKKLCKELEEIKNHKSMGMAEIEIVDKLTHAIKSIGAIMAMEEGESSYYGGMSRAPYRRSYTGRSYADDRIHEDDRRSYADGDSYASRSGMHYVRGHYSHAGNESDMLMDEIEDMIDDSNISLDEKSKLKKSLMGMRR